MWCLLFPFISPSKAYLILTIPHTHIIYITDKHQLLNVASSTDSADNIASLESKMIEKDDVVDQMDSNKQPSPSINQPTINTNRLAPGRYNDIDYSITLPFLKKPSNLDGSHAGDFGFGEEFMTTN